MLHSTLPYKIQIHALYNLLVPKPHPCFCSHSTWYITLTFHCPLSYQQVQSHKQYKSWSYSLYNTFQPSVTPSFLCLTFPQPPHNNNHSVRKTEYKTLSLNVPFCFVFFRMIYEYQINNVAVFIILSRTYHNSRHINIKKDTARCTADWQKYKFTIIYKMDQLWG